MVNLKLVATLYRNKYKDDQRYLKALELAIKDSRFIALNPRPRGGYTTMQSISNAYEILDTLIDFYLENQDAEVE